MPKSHFDFKIHIVTDLVRTCTSMGINSFLVWYEIHAVTEQDHTMKSNLNLDFHHYSQFLWNVWAIHKYMWFQKKSL